MVRCDDREMEFSQRNVSAIWQLLVLAILSAPATPQVCAGMQHLGSLGGISGGASDVSADGSVIVGTSATPTGRLHTFRWTKTAGMQDLGALGSGSVGSFVSADGSTVVGTWSLAPGRLGGFRWTESGGMHDLGFLPTFDSLLVSGVSEDGTVVVGTVRNGQSEHRAFRWTLGAGLQDLGALSGQIFSSALAVSRDGTTVVGVSEMNGPMWQPSAFRWTESAGMQPLNVQWPGGGGGAPGGAMQPLCPTTDRS